MFPIRDETPSGTFPTVTILLIAVNIGVYVKEVQLNREQQEKLMWRYAIVPARIVDAVSTSPENAAALAPSFFTSMFLHGGLFHLLGNMWYLWIFGNNVEDRLGRVRFLLFYLMCGLLAGFTHVYLHPNSPVPTIGASGAIAGVLGAYFISYPGARVLCLVFIFIFITFIRIPAFILLGFWFLMQLLSGTAEGHSNVAWWAHIGGFVAGMVLIVLLPKYKKAKPKRDDTWYEKRRQRIPSR